MSLLSVCKFTLGYMSIDNDILDGDGQSEQHIFLQKLCKTIVEKYASDARIETLSIDLFSVFNSRFICTSRPYGKEYSCSLFNVCLRHVVRLLEESGIEGKHISHLYDRIGRIYNAVHEYANERDICTSFTKMLQNIYATYVESWNAHLDAVIKFRRDVYVRVDIWNNNLPIWCTFITPENTHMDVLMRNPNNWILDGLVTESELLIHEMLRVRQWKVALQHPEEWITPDNYMLFNDEFACIEEFSARDLQIQDPKEMRVLQIWVRGMQDHQRWHMFFVKHGDRYVPVTMYTEEIKTYIERWKLYENMLDDAM